MKKYLISVRAMVEFLLRSGDIRSGFAGSVNANQRALEGTRLHQKLQKAAGGDYAREVAMSETRTILAKQEPEQLQEEIAAKLQVEGRADGIFTFAGDMIEEEKAFRLQTAKNLFEIRSLNGKRKKKAQQLSLDTENGAFLEAFLRPDGDELDRLDPLTLYRTVDEIKSVDLGLEYIDAHTYPLHFAQAKCYAHFLSEREDLPRVLVRLTYVHTETEQVKHLFRLYEREELKAFFDELIAAYEKWIRWQLQWETKRNASLKAMTFPFEKYRPGQRTMAAYVYKAIEEKKKVFLQAPTGIGKTMSALFPALKAVGEEKCEKIFYLTAKNVTKEAAEQGIKQLYQRGAKVKCLRITAKDRICFLEKRSCNPEDCPFAKGHFDRVNEAVLDSLERYDIFDLNCLQTIAEQYQVCPFELSLDIALWCDLIICDYNYAFDPSASLKRFFMSGKQNYVLLVDEAHNLVDRARSMFTAEICKQDVLRFRRSLPKEAAPVKALNQLNRLFLDASEKLGNAAWQRTKELALSESEWQRTLEKVCDRMGEYFELCGKEKVEIPEETWELYFQILFFLRVLPKSQEGYESYLENSSGRLAWRLYCVDPSSQLQEIYQLIRSAIFFSATLTPADYYKKLLGALPEEEAVALLSPFDKEKRKMLLSKIPVTYRTREAGVPRIANMIRETVCARPGHYLAFFPSYAFMQQVAEAYCARFGDKHVLVQRSEMTEEEKNDFLQAFRNASSENDDAAKELLGFAVLGGVFSEGVDLKGDALIGTVVVSVGLPQLGLERDLIKHYFDQCSGNGFDYAYQYPGIGRVFQAAGRVIRTEDDRGVILLIDQRFDEERYRKLYPPDWFPMITVDENSIGEVLNEFWDTLSETEEKDEGSV